MDEIKQILEAIRDLLWNNNEHIYDEYFDNALQGTEEVLWDFLVSNEMWGGAGSIADQGCIKNHESRRRLENLLIKLASCQQKAGKVNVRTDSWATAFEKQLTM